MSPAVSVVATSHVTFIKRTTLTGFLLMLELLEQLFINFIARTGLLDLDLSLSCQVVILWDLYTFLFWFLHSSSSLGVASSLDFCSFITSFCRNCCVILLVYYWCRSSSPSPANATLSWSHLSLYIGHWRTENRTCSFLSRCKGIFIRRKCTCSMRAKWAVCATARWDISWSHKHTLQEGNEIVTERWIRFIAASEVPLPCITPSVQSAKAITEKMERESGT